MFQGKRANSKFRIVKVGILGIFAYSFKYIVDTG